MKKTLLAVALTTVSTAALADVSLSGHVSAQITDRDSSDDTVFQQLGFSQSRFRIKADKEIKGLTFGINQEYGTGNEQSSINVRQHSLFVKGAFGTIRLGDHNDVGDGYMNTGVNGTWRSNPIAVNSFTHGTNGASNGFDPGRGQALRYYSPKIGGVATFGIQFENDGRAAAALNVGTHGFAFKAFAEDSGDAETDASGIMVGYRAPFGLGITYVAASKDRAASSTTTAAPGATFSVDPATGVIVPSATVTTTVGEGTDEFEGIQVGYSMGKIRASISKTERDNTDNGGAADTVDTVGAGFEYDYGKGVTFWVSYLDLEGNDVVADDTAVSLGALFTF
ncbi:MAG: porin [Cellvibrionaceae bacterium]